MKLTLKKYSGTLNTLGDGLEISENSVFGTLYSVIVLKNGENTIMLDKVAVSGKISTFLKVGNHVTLHVAENDTSKVLLAIESTENKVSDLSIVELTYSQLSKAKKMWLVMMICSIPTIFVIVGWVFFPWCLWQWRKTSKLADAFDINAIKQSLVAEGFPA